VFVEINHYFHSFYCERISRLFKLIKKKLKGKNNMDGILTVLSAFVIIGTTITSVTAPNPNELQKLLEKKKKRK